MLNKLLAIATLASSCFMATAVEASFSPTSTNWTHIRTLNDYRVYHKDVYTNIININGEKRWATWAKYVARETKPNMFYMKKDDYVMVQIQFLCSKRQYAIVSGTTHFSQGARPRASLVDDPHFITITPNSIEEKIGNRVCSKA